MTKTELKIAEAQAIARKPYADKIMEMTATQAELLAVLKRTTYFLGQVHAGNAFSEPVLWNELEQARAAIAKAERPPHIHQWIGGQVEGEPSFCPICNESVTTVRGQTLPLVGKP